MTINKVAVIGSGVMGGAIAAHLANAGVQVLLLDIPHQEDRNKIVKDAIERLKKSSPAAFMEPKFAERIEIGNTEDDLAKLKEYDWAIEAIIEKVEIKRDLYKRIDEICDGKIIVSSNTSSIPLHDLIAERSSGFQSNFMITHFFNPPRYMRLLEVVKGEKTNQATYDEVCLFADKMLGKGVVPCHDTPAFIANRIGAYAMMRTLDEALKSDLGIDLIDQIFTKVVSIPKTGMFGLLDLVGLDVMYYVGLELQEKLPATDKVKQLDIAAINSLIKSMIDAGYIGRKGKGGFYRLESSGDKKIKQIRNLKTGDYSPASSKIEVGSWEKHKGNIADFLADQSPEAQLVWNVISDVLLYAVSLVPEITDDIIYVDRAMRLGFNWKFGPFELLDRLNPAWFRTRLEKDKKPVPQLLTDVGEGHFYKIENGRRLYLTTNNRYTPITRPEGVLRLKDIKDAAKPLLSNPSANLWDIGDGAVCFEFTSKNNTIDPDLIKLLEASIDLVEKDYKALIIHNEADNFCYGANINLFLEATKGRSMAEADQYLKYAQGVFSRLKYSPFPVVGAPSGMALGGGCEILLHSNAIVAHAESYIGLVEVGVGIIPAWGGCKEMLLREDEQTLGGALLGFKNAFETIGLAKVSRSAFEAKKLKFLRPTDIIVMNRDRLLFEAKKHGLMLAASFKAPEEKRIKLPGSAGLIALKLGLKSFLSAGQISDYDMFVGERLAYVLSGGKTDILHRVSEQDLFDLERAAIIELIQNQKTIDRIMHILKTGKPLRN